MLSLRRLRKEFPRWKWCGIRRGFGWAYYGEIGERRVLLNRYARLEGRTEWRCELSGKSYYEFYLQNQGQEKED